MGGPWPPRPPYIGVPAKANKVSHLNVTFFLVLLFITLLLRSISTQEASCEQETYPSSPFLHTDFSFKDHFLYFKGHSELDCCSKENVGKLKSVVLNLPHLHSRNFKKVLKTAHHLKMYAHLMLQAALKECNGSTYMSCTLN